MTTTELRVQIGDDHIARPGHARHELIARRDSARVTLLLGQDLISHFPASEFVPSKGVIYNNVSVANPVAQKINYPSPMSLPILQYPYPYFGPVSIQGLNIGHSIIARALFDGMHSAVAEMKRLMLQARSA